MATPTIEAINVQDITIDTDYELEVSITGDPEEVTVDGLLEGFYYSWDADSDTLTIAGEATRLLGDAIWMVSAKETATSTAVTSEIVYNVVPSAPIIDEVGEQVVLQGVTSSFFVKIDNKPTTLKVDGLLTGYKYEPDTNDDGEEGITLSGELPLGTNLTIEDTIFEIEAMNEGGTDIYNLPIDFRFGSIAYIVNDGDIFVVNTDGTELWTHEPSGGGSAQMVVTRDGFYVLDGADDLSLVDTGGNVLWTYEGPSGTYNPPVAASDGIYLFNETTDDLLKVSLSGELLWTYEAPSGSYDSPVVASDGIYLFNDQLNSSNDDLLKVSPSGSLLWTYEAPSGFYDDPSFASDGIYLFNDTDDDLLKVSPSGSLLWTYEAPSGGYDSPVVDSGGVYLFSDGNNDLRKMSPSGELLWTYEKPSGGFSPLVMGSDGIYILGNTSGDLYKINPSTGAEIWSNIVGTGLVGDRYHDPVVSDDGVYTFWSTNPTLRKINPSTGAEIWSRTAVAFDLFDLVVSDDAIYIGDVNMGLLKLNPVTGTQLWLYPETSAETIGVLD